MKATSKAILVTLVLSGITALPAAEAYTVTHGHFAWVLHNILDSAGAGYSYEEIMEALNAGERPSPEAISRAIASLQAVGLSPHQGWDADQALTLHDITSVVVRFHGAENEVDLSDPDACLSFAQDKGCHPMVLQNVYRHLLHAVRSHKALDAGVELDVLPCVMEP